MRPHFGRETTTVRPRELPRDRNDIPGADLGEDFLFSIAPAFGKNHAGKDVYIDLSQVGWITPAEIVTLACSIRAIAERGTPCCIKLPDDANSPYFWTLKNYGFARALGASSQSDPWHQKIQFENLPRSYLDSGELNDNRRILPISWVDLGTFGYNTAPSNLYIEEPEFSPAYTRFIRTLLSRHGFVAEDAIDDFIRGILREIGWNAVLHSNKGKPGSFAAFAGQIFTRDNSLHFALADTGCGIASNLIDKYRAARTSGTVPAYERLYGCTESAATVRYSIESGSTSRKEGDFPVQYDMFSDRGLALVAEIVRESGELTLVSSGSAIKIGKQTPKVLIAERRPGSLPWTCLYGSLSARFGDHSPPPNSARIDIENEIKCADYYPAAIILRRSGVPSVKLIQRIRRRLNYTSEFAIVDVGFIDKSARNIENGIVSLIEALTPSSITLLNIRSQRVSPARIVRAMKLVGVNCPVTIRIATAGQNRLQELRVLPAHLDDTAHSTFNWQPVFLEERLYCDMHFRANNAFLEMSFGRDGNRHGFYQGKIHLLSGNVTDRYFSLIAHRQADSGDSFLRWTDAFGRLLDVAMSGAEHGTARLLGFAASMRSVLGSLDKAHPIRDHAYCLLSYDAPSKAELAEIIKPGDHVILCTDVVSSGSLLREMVSLVRRIGASIVGIIALIDARESPTSTWQTLFEPEVGGIPLFLAASLRRSVGTGTLSKGQEYWVDPVSAAPMSAIQESAVNIEEVLETTELLSDAQAVTLGHFVSGLRHTSVRIDMFKLLTERNKVANLTARKLRGLLEKEDWKTFRPCVALVPAGINRIDKLNTAVDAGGGKPSSEIYAEIVCDFFIEYPQVISVPRAFEPGGQATCAALGNISALHNLSDVLIVDDGISSGGTVRSLVHQAVRARAKRILVCVLLARTTPEELDQWALTREVADQSTSESALVSLIHPLHLPIPFAGEADCAQCTTLNSIGSRVSGHSSSKGGWQAIQKDLSAPYEYSPSHSDSLYVSTWLHVHSLAEIASRSSEGFEALKSFLTKLITDETESVNIKQEAVVRLFLVEWRLLGRARLRQVIRRSVSEIVRRQLDSPRTDERRFVEALSLVRSMFPDDYMETVRSHFQRIISSENILRRVLFHLGTLDSSEWELERMDVLHQMVNKLSECSHLEYDKIRQHQHLIERVTNDLGRTNQSTDIVYKLRALELALAGAAIVHDAIGPLTEIKSIDPARVETLREDGYFGPLVKQIEGNVIPAIEKELYPLLVGLGELFDDQLKHLKLQGEVQSSYFEIGHSLEVSTLDRDIQYVLQNCQNIHSKVLVKQSLEAATKAAKNLLNKALLPNSALSKVLESLSSYSVTGIMSLIQNALRGICGDSSICVEPVPIEDGHDENTRVVCTEPLIVEFIMLANQNLKKHALNTAEAPGTSLRLSISVGFAAFGNRSYAVFRLSNSGPPPSPKAIPRIRSRVLERKLEMIDGHFVPVEPGCNGFGAATSIKLRVYNRKT